MALANPGMSVCKKAELFLIRSVFFIKLYPNTGCYEVPIIHSYESDHIIYDDN